MRIGVSSGSSMHRPTRNFTPTRTWASRGRETPPRSARSGNLCAWPAPPRAHVSSRLPRTAGASRPRNAARKIARSSTIKAVAHSTTARWSSRAAAVTPPKAPPLKEASAFRLIGRSLKRLDTPDKVNGKATYGIDVLPPGVKFATHAASPVLGGTVAHVDDRRAKAVPGVRQIVVLDDLVAVVGDHMWAAKCGLAALDITWNDGPNAEVSSELIWSRLRSASLRDGAVAKEVGDVKKALGSSGEASSEVVTAAFELPLLAHACMEPLNCTVHVTPTSAEAWIGTQVMERVHAAVAKAAGLPESQVTVHNHLLGGGFGRKLEPDMAYTAARIAKQVDGTCQGGVDPRGRHPSRFLSTGLPRPPLGALGGRPHRRLEAQSIRLGRECSISARRFSERCRS